MEVRDVSLNASLLPWRRRCIRNSAIFVILALGALSGSSVDFDSQIGLSKGPDHSRLTGEWIYVEDLTEGHTLEQMNPPMGSKFSFLAEENGIVLVSGHSGNRRDVRVALDGSMTEVPGANPGEMARYRGSWKEGAFTYEIDFIRSAGGSPEGLIRREFRVTPDGMIVRSNLGSKTDFTYVGLYRKAEDIAMPVPAKAVIGDLSWLTGAWVGARGTNGSIKFEERWGPAKGGAMLATSQTVNSSGRMSAFEFLRIVERDGGLVYIAQPGGAAPTEFVLSEISSNRAVFENPRHDYPKRIVYELLSDDRLVTSTGFMKGGTPRMYEYRREEGQ